MTYCRNWKLIRSKFVGSIKPCASLPDTYSKGTLCIWMTQGIHKGWWQNVNIWSAEDKNLKTFLKYTTHTHTLQLVRCSDGLWFYRLHRHWYDTLAKVSGFRTPAASSDLVRFHWQTMSLQESKQPLIWSCCNTSSSLCLKHNPAIQRWAHNRWEESQVWLLACKLRRPRILI